MSENRYNFMDLPIWVYEGILKNTQAGAQNVSAQVTLASPGERLFHYHLCLGPNDYAAARDLQAIIETPGSARIAYMIKDSIDNVEIYGPCLMVHDTKATDDARSVGVPIMPYPQTKKHEVRFNAAALVQNEEFTFHILAFHHSLGSEKPTVTLITASGATLTENTNEIV